MLRAAGRVAPDFDWSSLPAFAEPMDCPIEAVLNALHVVEHGLMPVFKGGADVLGAAYKTFLKDAGGIDNRNIILTPEHVRTLMLRLARIGRGDAVLDTCTGTGGFLLDAARLGGECHLMGFEVDQTMFALAYANSVLSGCDCKVYRCDSMSQEVDGLSLAFRANKAVINPPYENNGSMRFALRTLELMEPGGILVAIMPSSTLSSNLSNGLTEKLLKSAAFDFRVNMPQRLFGEQGRSVNTSIFGFTKGGSQGRVAFYDLTDDGFESVQHRGRVDKDGLWREREDSVVADVLGGASAVGACELRDIVDGEGNLLPDGVAAVADGDGTVRLGDVFDCCKGTLPSGKAKGGAYAFVTAGGCCKTHDSYSHDGEALVVAVSAAGSLGRTYHVRGKFTASNLCVVLTPKEGWRERIDMRFMSSYIDSMRDELRRRLAGGSSKLVIKPSDLMDYRIALPDVETQVAVRNEFVRPLDGAMAEVARCESALAETLARIRRRRP